jgi:hypothetical protein
MKNLTIFLLVFSMVFMACETDFEVNADWKEVMIVYGLLDQSQTQQYIKINKAFLGEGDALQMASVSGSVNYNPEDLEVTIIKVKDAGNDTIYLDTTLIVKDDGLFATDENIIYVTNIDDSNFFVKDKEYILFVLNKKSGHEVSAKTHLIHGLKLTNNTPLQKMSFYDPILHSPPFPPPPYEKRTTTVNWDHSTNGRIYQIIARIYYWDFFSDGTSSLEYLEWVQPTQLYDGRTNMEYTFDGDVFVNHISKNIPTPTDLLPDILDSRLLAYMELRYTVGSEDLYTYMEVNEPFEGIVQERPSFTNINNGIGLFSSRFNKLEEWTISDATQNGISLELSHLGF